MKLRAFKLEQCHTGYEDSFSDTLYIIFLDRLHFGCQLIIGCVENWDIPKAFFHDTLYSIIRELNTRDFSHTRLGMS